jgi:hypothetical protein
MRRHIWVGLGLFRHPPEKLDHLLDLLRIHAPRSLSSPVAPWLQGWSVGAILWEAIVPGARLDDKFSASRWDHHDWR